MGALGVDRYVNRARFFLTVVEGEWISGSGLLVIEGGAPILAVNSKSLFCVWMILRVLRLGGFSWVRGMVSAPVTQGGRAIGFCPIEVDQWYVEGMLKEWL